jgi:hypothetical protein
MLLKVVRNYKMHGKFYPRGSVIKLDYLGKEMERLIVAKIFRIIPEPLESQVVAEPMVIDEPKKKKGGKK